MSSKGIKGKNEQKEQKGSTYLHQMLSVDLLAQLDNDLHARGQRRIAVKLEHSKIDVASSQ